MAHKLLEAIIHGRTSLIRGRLGQAFDGHVLIGLGVRREEDHAKGAMVQGGDGAKATIQKLMLGEIVLQARHSR